MCKGLPLIYCIKNKEGYLGIAWYVALINAIIFSIPVVSILVALTFSSFGFPVEFVLGNPLLSIYILVALVSSIVFLVKSKYLKVKSFGVAFKYSLLPILSMVVLVVFILFASVAIIYT
jgi:hypothetical protein